MKKPTLYSRAIALATSPAGGFTFNPVGQLVVRAPNVDAHEPLIIVATGIALQEREDTIALLRGRQARAKARGDLLAARTIGQCIKALQA